MRAVFWDVSEEHPATIFRRYVIKYEVPMEIPMKITVFVEGFGGKSCPNLQETGNTD
jgi:hypothetical protein